jgi:predicted dehydrogenase
MTGNVYGGSNPEFLLADRPHGTSANDSRGTGRAFDRALRIKVYGAGSIGNHIAHAARRLGWSVVVCDISADALKRMRSEIYPGRYGAWDSAIELYESRVAPVHGFDVVHIGTPPASHIPVALAALSGHPAAVLIEKPLCPPNLAGIADLRARAEQTRTSVFVGYDHVVGKAARRVDELLLADAIGRIITIDVDFREHWGGILAAHPWLKGPTDSYLGNWREGGGASGEHSHATNLWQHFAHQAGAGRVVEVAATLRYEQDGNARWDATCLMNLRTESGVIGRVAQDVVTVPPRKRALIQGELGTLQWVAGYSRGADAVVRTSADGREDQEIIAKTRPDDFIEELEHVRMSLANGRPSPIRLERGIDTMLVIRAAHESAREGRAVAIEHAGARSGHARPA